MKPFGYGRNWYGTPLVRSLRLTFDALKLILRNFFRMILHLGVQRLPEIALMGERRV
jgi:hypothetical protein